jgi:hypothetical protein
VSEEATPAAAQILAAPASTPGDIVAHPASEISTGHSMEEDVELSAQSSAELQPVVSDVGTASLQDLSSVNKGSTESLNMFSLSSSVVSTPAASDHNISRNGQVRIH